jgi:hypothetical protein
MRRTLVLCLLALLLSLQHEAQVHPFSHLASRPAHCADTGMASTIADGECARCALLAAGSNAVPAASHSPALAECPGARMQPVLRSRSVSAPVYFSSRAPPFLS